ncbi:MAG: hypothetical protein RQ745_05985 [Longimicrobiales bacterium]|nr:hypothetical protein [Longimicrobiales bacterium]
MTRGGAALRDEARTPYRRSGLRRWLDALLPAHCHGCGVPVAPDNDACVCINCRLRLERPPAPRCSRCDHPAHFAVGECPGCEILPEVLETVRSAVVLRPPADALVHAFKYGGWRSLAPFLAARMRPLLPGDARALVPVASPRKRERERGFNPPQLIAEVLAGTTGIPLVHALRRPRESRRQVGLSPEERKANVRDAFVPAVDHLDGPDHHVLIDDVFTTGATSTAAAAALQAAGAERVSVLTFARALPSLFPGDDAS